MADITVKPNTKQQQVLKLLSNPQIEIMCMGSGKGSGKSYTGRLWMIMRALKYPNSRGLIIRKGFPDLQRSVIDKIKQEYPGVYQEYNDKLHKFTFSNGSEIELGYLDSQNDVQRYFGSEKDSIFLDEGQQHSKYVFDILRTSLRTINKDIKPRMFISHNWGDIGHSWIKKLFWEKIYDEGMDPESFAYINSTILDNPDLMEADPGYVKRLESLPPETRKMYLEGSPEISVGQFFTGFSTTLAESPFLIPTYKREGRIFGSLDVGVTHSCAFALWYVDEDNIIHKLLTYNQKLDTHGAHAQEIYDLIESFPHTGGYFPETIWCDPAGFTSSHMSETNDSAPVDEWIKLFKRRGKQTKFEKANNNRVHGSMTMRQVFHERRLRYFDKYNKGFVEAIQSAIVDPNQPEAYKKVDTDGDNEVDNVRYGILGCLSQLNNFKEAYKPKTHLEKLLKGKLPHQQQKNGDFFAVGTRIGGA